MRRALVLSAVLLTACGGSRPRAMTSTWLPNVEARVPFDPDEARKRKDAPSEGRFEVQAGDLSGPLSGAPAVSRRSAGVVDSSLNTIGRVLAGGASPATVAAPHALPPVNAGDKGQEKIELEAQLAVAVSEVAPAAARVAALVREHGGRIATDQRSTSADSHAELHVRVPSASFEPFLAAVARLGDVRSRRVRAIDATLEHRDLGALLANLEAAEARYRALLEKAADAAQVLAVERELERVRGEIDRLRARLAYLEDRAAMATIAIGLHAPVPEDGVTTGFRPHLAPGLRGLSFVDVREAGTRGYFGTGLSMRLPRSMTPPFRGFVLDVDVMRSCCKARPERTDWAFLVLTGFDVYSEALDEGRRSFFNPFLGVRAGYAQLEARGDFAAAAVFGLEILKTRSLSLDVQTRVLALVGNPAGPHLGIQPSLGFDLGF